jgi:tRNA(Met) C34 N-acetyltransferase TmcA
MNLIIDFILGNQYVVGALGALIGIGLFLFKKKSKNVVIVKTNENMDEVIETVKENAEDLENKAHEAKETSEDHIEKSNKILDEIKEVTPIKVEPIKPDSGIEELDDAFKDKNF